MTPLRIALSCAGLLATATLAVGCSASSGGSVPAPTPTPTGAQAPVANSLRGASTLALDALKTVRYYAQYIAPGAGSPHAVPTPNPAPSCEPATQTALSSTVDQGGKNYVVVTAFYPQGDRQCAQSPYAVIEMYYPDVHSPQSRAPQDGIGYEATFEKGLVSEFDVVATQIYAAGNSANVDTRIDRYGADQSPALVLPPPGTFPETFPLAFPLPNPPPVGQGQSFVSDFYATAAKGGGRSQTGTASLVLTNADFLPYETLGLQQNLAAIDSLSVTVNGPSRDGTYAYTATHDAPLYAFDAVPISLTSGGGFLGPGKTQWALNPLTSGFSASNFGGGPSDKATFAVNGSIVSDAQTFEDVVNKVTAALTIGGSSSSLSETDDLRHAPATNPAAIALRSNGSSPRFTYRRDHSIGLVLVNSVAE